MNKENSIKVTELLHKLDGVLNNISKIVSKRKESELGQIKIVLLDLMRRIHVNLYALKTIQPELVDNKSLALPIGLIMRTCVTDALTGLYLLTFSKDEESFKNELLVMGLEYVGYLEKLACNEPSFMTPDTPEEELKQIIYNQLEEIASKYPELVIKRENFKLIKKTSEELRSTSNEGIFPYRKKYMGRVTDSLKFERLNKYPGIGVKSLSYLYPLFRFYSQFHHYTIYTRKLIDMGVEEHLKHMIISLVLIHQALHAFGSECEIPDDLLKPIELNLDKLLEYFIEEK